VGRKGSFYGGNRLFRLLAGSFGWNDLPGAIKIG